MKHLAKLGTARETTGRKYGRIYAYEREEDWGEMSKTRMNRRRIHSVYRQRRSCAGTAICKLAGMNFAIRAFSLSASNGERVGVRCRFRRNADSLRQDLHPALKADFVPVRKDLANPPFNMSDWGGENLRQDVRWKIGMPPVNNANYAWIQHFIRHLSPVGVAGFVLPNFASSSE